MPKVAIDYSKQYISFYKFICQTDGVDNTYVGSTINFRGRKARHKSVCNNANTKDYNFKVYQIIRANGGWNNWSMIEICSQLCKSKLDSKRIEQDYITELRASMNSYKAVRSEDTIKEYNANRYKQHRVEKKETNRLYRQQHREDAKLYYQNHREDAKLYYQNHRAELNEYQRLYQQRNRDEKRRNNHRSASI